MTSHLATTRRSLLRASAALGAVSLAGCNVLSSSTTGGVTTITVNVAALDQYGQAFINAAQLIGGLPGIVGSPMAVALGVLGPIVSADLAAFDKEAAGKLTLTFDSTSVPSAISSLLKSGQQVLADAQVALPSATSGAVGVAQQYIAALSVVVSLFQAAIAGTAPQAAAPQVRQQALKTLRVI